MSERGARLLATADAQLDALQALLARRADADLRRPGREGLGDGTAGALAAHVIESYVRIAAFVAGEHGARHHDAHRAGSVHELRERLAEARAAVRVLADLDDAQLEATPPAGAFRFADGQRTLERVVSGALQHQSRQIDALKAVLQ